MTTLSLLAGRAGTADLETFPDSTLDHPGNVSGVMGVILAPPSRGRQARRRVRAVTSDATPTAPHSPAVASSPAGNPAPAATSPTTSDPNPVPASNPMFQTALARDRARSGTAAKAATSVRFCRLP